jgi:hypothetical protein
MRFTLAVLAMTLCCACSDSDSSSGEDAGEYYVVGSDQGGAADAAADVPANPIDGTTDEVEPDAPAPVPEVVDTPDVGEDPGPPPCTPQCAGADCGSDGCSGLCGTCEAGEICSEASSCEPDPEAGCGGLDLAEDWAGTFEGVHDSKVLGGLIPASEGDTDGDLAFSIECLNSKFIVNGQVSGTASGDNPFELTLTGTYNPTTKELKGTVPTGHVLLVDTANLDIEFAGEMPGVLQADGTFLGTYAVEAVGGTSILGPLDMSQLSASSSGTWTAAPAP